ncbi:MAG TPA: non-heme iron oxygenase ferredoxin subunit [Tepidiformaceae bacterium]|nr:non-heme iron oxygenase ferredoxin subunit [Tepidiformaceae bacterium]HNO66377.1 non-heme iron oxygenase ferredoxin subunit [Tepidiformaceae bacterium]
MSWVRVASATDIEAGHAHVVEAQGRRIALCNTGDGFYAIDDVCTHDGGPLDQGTLMGYRIECPRHGAQFDVRTGKVLALPAVRPVRSYKTRVENGEIEVEV